MTRSLIYITLLNAAAAWGQAAAPAFEVASIRPSPPTSPTARTPPYANVDKAGVRLRLPLQGVVCMAYNVRADQIVAPAWLANTRFDIEAKLPQGATEEQIPPMLQNLLADRFQMTVHHESREQPVYALVVGKDGLKMKPKPAAAPGADAPPPRTMDGCNPRVNQGTTADGKGSTVTNGDMKMSMHIDGQKVEVSIETSRTTTLAEWLTTELTLVKGILGGGPSIVIDKTNLTGEYPIRLAQSAEGDSGAIVPGQSPAPLGDPWFFGAIEKLGLKLERQKAQIETIVIDQIEKTPTEN
jgi:uncharacterized protein (TIGR03435 family)